MRKASDFKKGEVVYWIQHVCATLLPENIIFKKGVVVVGWNTLSVTVMPEGSDKMILVEPEGCCRSIKERNELIEAFITKLQSIKDSDE